MIQETNAETRKLDESLQAISDIVSTHLSSFLNFQSAANALEDLIGSASWQYETQAYERTIVEPISDMLARASKKWRPIFAILMLESLGCDPTHYTRLVSLALELPHTAALIIDDIEDASELRRGDTCIHVRYGTDIALNAANFLYFIPYWELQKHEHLTDQQKLRAHAVTSRCYLRGHIGQATDIWRSSFFDDAISGIDSVKATDTILQTYADKTACAVEAAMDLVAIIAEIEDEEMIRALRSFACSVGVGFQIIDDVHNFSDSPEWTKTVGEDLATGKITYVTCRALSLLPKVKRDTLLSILKSARCTREITSLSDGIDLVRESGALEECRQRADEMLHRGWQEFCQYVSDSHARRCLLRLCSRIYSSLNAV